MTSYSLIFFLALELMFRWSEYFIGENYVGGCIRVLHATLLLSCKLKVRAANHNLA